MHRRAQIGQAERIEPIRDDIERGALVADEEHALAPCEVISEDVTIALRRRTVFGSKGQLFVRCSESDCQWVDANEPPCPLTLELFADEVREREAQRFEER